MEYSSSVWSPVYCVEINRIESVQRRFTKRLSGFAKYDYETRFSMLDIGSLELRRLFNDLILVYKILFKLLDVNVNDFALADSSHETRAHKYKLFVNHCRINTRKHFFSERVLQSWNSLTVSQGDFDSIKSFKSCLERNRVTLSKFFNHCIWMFVSALCALHLSFIVILFIV